MVGTLLSCSLNIGLTYTLGRKQIEHLVGPHLCKTYMPLYAQIISGRTDNNFLIVIISKVRILFCFIIYPCVLSSLIFRQ